MLLCKVCLVLCLSYNFIKITKGADTKIPDYIHVCKRTDPKVDECIIQSVDQLRPKLAQGIPEINAPAIEPFYLHNLTIFGGANQTQDGFLANLYNFEISGCSNFQINSLNVNVDKLIIRCDLTFPVLNFLADYNIDGKIIFLKLQGNGKFKGNATNVQARTIMRANIVENGDRKQMKFNHMDVKVKVGDYSVVLENLFGGDPVLGKATNDVINDAKEEMLGVVIPLLEKEFSKIIIDFSNRITSRFDYDNIFPV
ncbi:unnamed protein product [Brassicogethes aeneus]|uniref:Uncharacterized protein n=1 Tax=Brassicogethes aeneus TaxID=1431903 RepID=A0A9P0B657_BRAAE|nr:unnamed protein product [Brassicogethes aeneus]